MSTGRRRTPQLVPTENSISAWREGYEAGTESREAVLQSYFKDTGHRHGR